MEDISKAKKNNSIFSISSPIKTIFIYYHEIRKTFPLYLSDKCFKENIYKVFPDIGMVDVLQIYLRESLRKDDGFYCKNKNEKGNLNEIMS